MISKVCRLAWDYPRQGRSTYGLQPVYVGLSEAQVKQGYEVHVITAANGGPQEEEVNGVLVHRLPSPLSVNSLRLIRRLVVPGREWVVHAHATCGMALTATKYIRPFALVTHVHGTSRSHHTPLTYTEGRLRIEYSSLSVNYHMLRERLFWSSADRVLTVSKTSMEDVTSFYRIPERRVRVVYNGYDRVVFDSARASTFPPSISNLQGKRIILYVGHFGLRKGLFFLLKAMAQVRKEVPEAHLVCIGGVPKWLGKFDFWKMLNDMAGSSGVTDCVTFLEAVPQAELFDYYASCEVFVLPSYYETFSKVTLEAMACGKPVVATNAGGLREVVDQNETGLLVDFASVPQLSDAIISLLEDKKRAEDMGRRGKAKAEANYTWEAVAKRVAGVYRELSK